MQEIFWRAGTNSEEECVPLRTRFRIPLRTHSRVERSIFTEHSSEKITSLKSSPSATIFKQCYIFGLFTSWQRKQIKVHFQISSRGHVHISFHLSCLKNKIKMERIIYLFVRNRESTFQKKPMFFDGELWSSVRISHGSEHWWAIPIII